MKQNKNSLFSLVSNQHGSVAIIMVLSAVAILTPLIVNFTFESAINKIKTGNKEDRYRARLTAESGLTFAMARLKLYKEAFNFVQKNESAKDIAKPETLNMIWNFPFVYPIPVQDSMNAIQKEAIGDFMEATFLEGSLNLTINNISNKLNLNMLRISILAEAIKENDKNNSNSTENNSESNENGEEDQQYNMDSQLFKSLTNVIEEKSDSDEFFSAQYYGMEVSPLVNELKYFVSDDGSIEDTGGADSNFTEENRAKLAPLVSFSELYTLPSWPDEIINLIKNEYTVHGALMVDLNKITDKLLKLLIPDITPEDIDEFFKYKNDEEDPKYFNTRDDFKNYIVNIGNIMNESDFDERMNKFESQGLRFGPSPTLFRVVSTGTVGRSTYNLTAFVTLPAQPSPRPKKKINEENGEQENQNNSNENTNENNTNENNTNENSGNNQETKQKTLLLNPRVVEILIN